MPHTDAAWEGRDEDEPWHVWTDEEVDVTPTRGSYVAKSVAQDRLLSINHLMPIKDHARREFFDSLSPQSLVDWLAHPKVCDECRREIAAKLNIEMEAVRARLEIGKREGRL